MVDAILRLALKQRLLVVFLTAVVAGVGAWSLLRLPIDAVPDITNVQVQINTTVAGLTPEDIERQVTWPIETGLAGISGLNHTRSLSRNGFAQVTAVFADDTDIFFARQQIAERLSQTRSSLPLGAEPGMGPIATGLGEVLMYTVRFAPRAAADAAQISTSEAAGWQTDGSYRTPEGEVLRTETERAAYLRTVQDWLIAPQLRTVAGVAGIDAIGGYRKQYLIAPDPFRLLAHGLTMADVVCAIERNNQSLGAGAIERFGESFVVRTDGRVRSAADLAEVTIPIPGAAPGMLPVRVRDLATVTIDGELRTGSASRDGAEAVVGTVLMLMGENSRTVAAAASVRLAQVGKSLPVGVQVEAVLNRQTLVDATIATVEKNLLEGAILVIAVLFLLLGNLRGAFIAMLTIPLSMLFAAIGMNAYGISGNLMSLGAIDFGIIVDSAVIIVENCLRRLGERQRLLGRLLTLDERLQEVFLASREMVQPAVFGQLVIITVYVPILLLTGIEGKMFTPMGATVIFALLGALILSLTLVPALVALLVRGKVAEHDNALMRVAKRGYAPVVQVALRARYAVLGAALVLLIGCAWLSTRLGSEFIPTLSEGNLAMHAMRIPSVGITQSTAMQLQVEDAVRTVPEVALVFSKTGTAEMASDPMPPNVSDTFIMLKPKSQWPDPRLSSDQLLEKIYAQVAAEPGNNYEFSQPIQMRFNELISGVRADVALKLFGDDFAVLLPAAERLAATLRAVPGATGVKVEQVEGLPALSINLRRPVLASLGLDVAAVQSAIATAIGGTTAGMVFEGDRRFAIVVRLADAQRRDLDALRRLPLLLPSSALSSEKVHHHRTPALPRFVALGEVAELTFTDGTNQISRENGKRRIVVQANVRGRDLGSFVAEAKTRIEHQVPLPTGTWLSWGGQYENLQAASARLLIVVPLCFAIIFILLFSTFGSVTYAALVFTGVPLALTGGVLGLWVRGMPFSISAAVGFIALSGVAVLNGVVMVARINQLRAQGVTVDDAIMQGCLTRLRPVLMTALVAALGFVPMALATGTGAEVQRPLATVVVFGILTSTLLTLVVLPALYRLWHRRAGAEHTDEAPPPDRVSAAIHAPGSESR